jgi:hypothetical protein
VFTEAPKISRALSLSGAVFALGVVLIPITDFGGFGGAGGVFLRSPSGVLFLLSYFIFSVLNGRTFTVNWLLLLFGLCVAVATVLYASDYGHNSVSGDPFGKAFNVFVLLLTFLAVVYSPVRLNTIYLRVAVIVAWFVVIIGFVTGDIIKLSLVSEVGVFHTTINVQQRPRGFSLESSVLASQVAVLGCLSIWFTRSFVWRSIFFLGSCFVVFYALSKGAIIAAMLCCGVVCVVALRRHPIVLAMLAIGVTLALPSIYEATDLVFAGSIASGTSVTTRASLFLSGVHVVLTHPFGAGFGTVADKLRASVIANFDWIRSIFPFPFNGAELYAGFIHATNDYVIGTKSGILDLVLLLGWPGVFIVYRIFVGPLLKPRSIGLVGVFAMALVLVMTAAYVPVFGYYHFALVLLVMRMAGEDFPRYGAQL